MNKLIGRYLASSFIAPFIVSVIFFVSFLLTTQLFKITRIVTKKGVDFWTVAELVAHIGISFLPMAIPLSALFSVIYTLNKMSEDSEIVAMRSFGISKYSLLSPFLILSVIIGVTVFSLNRKIIPYSQARFKNTIVRLTSKGVLTDIRPGQFFTEIPNITLFAEEVNNDGTRMDRIFIQSNNIQTGEEKIIMARVGHLIKQSQSKWEAPTLRLHLKDGNLFTMKQSGEKEKILFKEYDFPVLTGGVISSFVTKDAMRTNDELSAIIDDFENQQRELAGKEDQKSMESLQWLVTRKAAAKLEYWSRFNTPLQCIIFIFLGFSLGIKKGRGKSKNTTLIGMIVLIVYYSIYFIGVAFSNKGQVSPQISVFFPSLIALAVGTKYFKNIDWAS